MNTLPDLSQLTHEQLLEFTRQLAMQHQSLAQSNQQLDAKVQHLEVSNQQLDALYTTNFTEPLSYQGSAFLKLPKFP